jgi:hypothetical protein
MTDPNTLDPEEIGKLPVDRNKPFNGLSEEQVRAFGRDPEEVEQSRLEQNAFEAAKALQEDATLVQLANQAVEDWEMTPAQAALALAESGHSTAHELFLRNWRATEAQEAAAAAADEIAWEASELDAESYATQHNARKVIERAQLEQEAADTKIELDNARIEALRERLDSVVSSTPGAHAIKSALEQRVIEKVQQSGELPSTDAERDALIVSARNEFVAVDTAIESLRQQIDTEYRFHRKANGARDGLMTKADIDNAERYWKQARFDQLAAAKEIDVESLKPAPSAEEQSAALTERYAAKQERSDSFARNVAGMAEAGRSAKEAADRGVGFGEERRRYKEAYAKAEAEAQYGEVRTAVGAVEEAPAQSGALDEYGDAFGRPV